MRKAILGFIFLTVFAGRPSAQDNWNRYSWGTFDREGFTVLLPTIPEQVLKENGEQGISAFIDFVTYTVTFKDGVNQDDLDRQVREFSRVTGDGPGTGTIKKEAAAERTPTPLTKEVALCRHSGIEIGNLNSVQQLFLVDNRLYRVSVTGANKSNPNVTKFLESFTLVKPWEQWKGIRTNEPFDDSRVGRGSQATFESSVCKNIGKTETKDSFTKLAPSSALRLTSKPPAEYPEAAKKKGLQGTVSLRVTFLSDGSIGAIAVVKGIDKEIDQSAINAAKLIKFEPQRQGGKSITITKTIEYTFAIY